MFVCKDQKIWANMLPKTLVEASVARLKQQKNLVNCFSISQFIATENRWTTSVFQYFTVYFQLNGSAFHILWQIYKFWICKNANFAKKVSVYDMCMACICICCTLDIKVVPQYSYCDLHLILFLNGLWINNQLLQ